VGASNNAQNNIVKGNGGNIEITTDQLLLNGAGLLASTTSGNGGNITFNLSDYLLLRNGSLISTNAGTASSGGNGGNITINTPFIITLPLEICGFGGSRKCCSSRTHKNGTVTYFHSAILPVIVAPGQSQVITLATEFITPVRSSPSASPASASSPAVVLLSWRRSQLDILTVYLYY